MRFRISGLPAGPFTHLYGRSDEALAGSGVRRYIVDSKPGFPCRVTLADAEPGERVLLLNYVHQPADSPYRSSHAIFVREGATQTAAFVDEVPEVLRLRSLSVRAFDAAGMMTDAELVDGTNLEAAIARLFSDPRTAYAHAHYAMRGCFAARVERHA